MRTTTVRPGLETLAEWSRPTREAFDEAVRDARRALVDARHAAEDVTAGTVLKIRRRPLAAVGLAMCTGTMVGVAIGFVLTRLITPRTS